MMIRHKKFGIKELDEKGRGMARIVGDMNGIDNDGDTYEAGAFNWKSGDGQWAMIMPAHRRDKVPLGKARVFENGAAVDAELFFNLETQEGRNWHAALMFDLATGQPVQEWSFGYTAKEIDFRMDGINRVRVLKKLDVSEASPVLRGAGLGTGTLDVKSASIKAVRFDQLIDELDEIVAGINDDPDQLSATGLKQMQAIHAHLTKALEAKEAPPAPADDAEAEHLVASFLFQSARPYLPKE